MKTKHSGLIMGPAAAPQAPTATKFWNMASTGDDEGEITLYGDVMSQQPVDWWTGEPKPGLSMAITSLLTIFLCLWQMPTKCRI